MKRTILSLTVVLAALFVCTSAAPGQGRGGARGGHGGGGFHNGGRPSGGHHATGGHTAGGRHVGAHATGGHTSGGRHNGGHASSSSKGGHKGGKGMTTKPGKSGGSKSKPHPHHHHHHHKDPGYGGSGWGGGSGVVVDGYGYSEGSGSGSGVVAGGQGGTRQDRRYLRVKNDTGEKMTVYVQYQTISQSKGWTWYPVAPGSEPRAVVYTFAPGQEADLRHEDWPVNANRVRIWACAASGEEFAEYRDEDLWLVEEIDGERVYYADEGETFTFTFAR